MTWNYRVCKTSEGYFELRECYYNENGELVNWTNALSLDGYESPEELANALRMMMVDAATRPVVEGI